MPDEIFGVMAVKNGQKQTIMNLSNARQKSYADLQNMTDAQKKGVIVCPDYPTEEFLVTANEVSYGNGTVKDALDALNEATTSDGMHNATAEADITVREYLRWWQIGKMVVVDFGGISTNVSGGNVLVTQNLPLMCSRPTGVLRSDTSQDTALVYGSVGTSQLRFSGGYNLNTYYYGQVMYLTD